MLQVHANFAHPWGELARWQQAFQSLKDGFLQKIRTDVSWFFKASHQRLQIDRFDSIHQQNACN